MTFEIKINGENKTVDADGDIPLLWILRDVLGLTGTKFGCGIGQCGACTVHIDGEPRRACLTTIDSIGGSAVTTIEAIGATEAGKAIQNAWIALEVPQCGYCQSGQIMSATALLSGNANPSDGDIDDSHVWQYLPLRHLSAYPRCNQARGTVLGAFRKERVRPCAVNRKPKPSIWLPLSGRVILKAIFPAAAFLRVSATTGGGLLLAFSTPQAIRFAGAQGMSAPGDFAPNGFIRIDRDGRITLIVCQVEMGQGTYTSMPMLIAEELEVELSQIQVEHAPPSDRLYGNPLVGFQVTGGSTSVRAFWKPLRQAGAAARMLLVEAAAQIWGVEPASCRAEKGEVLHGPSGRKLTYGALAEKAAALPAAFCGQNCAQGPRGLQVNRHAGQARGYAQQGQWIGAIRHRC